MRGIDDGPTWRVYVDGLYRKLSSSMFLLRQLGSLWIYLQYVRGWGGRDKKLQDTIQIHS